MTAVVMAGETSAKGPAVEAMMEAAVEEEARASTVEARELVARMGAEMGNEQLQE